MPTTRTPAAGELFRLDGFPYRLDGIDVRHASDGTPVGIRAFTRPPAPDPDTEARYVANNSYKRAGKCRDDELVWYEPHDWADALRVQAAQAVKVQAPAIRPAMKLWTDAAVEALLDAYGAEGCWGLPDRHLLKLPVDLDGRVLWPGDATEAAALARSILHSEG